MKRMYAVLLIALATTGCATVPDGYVYGPRPEWTRYKALGEAALRTQLPDADSWSIEWPNGYAPFVWFHKGRFPGYATCGRLRKLVPTDGRSPVVNFGVVIDHDMVKKAQISSRESNSLVNMVCNELVSRGKLPPARMMEAADAPASMTVASLGLELQAMPEGAYVIAAHPGLSAESAGLVPGMVITRVNGIPLAGLGAAMATLLDSDTPSLALETATGDHLEVRRGTSRPNVET